MYRVWLRWVARPEFARAECLSCQSQPSLFRAKESPLNIEIIAKGKTSVIFFCFKRYEQQLNPVVWVIVLCCVRGFNGHMGEYLMRAIITHRTQHSLLNFSGWCICPQCLSCSSGNSVASVFQTARIFVVCLISKINCLLSVNPGLVWIPSYMLSMFFVFCKSSWLPFHQENIIV